MILDGLKYPFTLQDKNLWRKVLIGSVLLLTSPLIFPLVLYLGYFQRLVESIITEKTELPDFRNVKNLAKKGGKILGILCIYTILVLTTLWSVFSMEGPFKVIVGFIVSFIYVIILHLTPLLLYNYITTDSIKSAFDISSVVSQSFSYKYTYITLIMSLIYPIIFGIIQGIVILTIIGVLFIPLVIFWQTISQAYILAQLKDMS